MILRPFVAIPETLRDWTRWAQDQLFPSVAVTVILTTHTAGSEDIILVDDDTAGGAVTVTLLALADKSGKIYDVKKLGTTGSVTVDADGSETIDGATTKVLSSQYDSVRIFGGSAEWNIL